MSEPSRHGYGSALPPLDARPAVNWDDDMGLVIPCGNRYAIEPGSQLRGTECALCGQPAGSTLVSVHVVVSNELCSQGRPHLSAYAVIMHVACEMAREDEVMPAAVAASRPCLNL